MSVAREEDVLGLKISVDDIVRVKVANCQDDLANIKGSLFLEKNALRFNFRFVRGKSCEIICLVWLRSWSLLCVIVSFVEPFYSIQDRDQNITNLLPKHKK